MSIEDFEQQADALINEWKQGTPQPSSEINMAEAEQMGLIKPNVQDAQTQQSQESQQQQGDSYLDYLNNQREYEKLGVGESWKDMGKTVAAEGLRFFAPKAGSKVANILHFSEDDLYQHQAQTHFAENMKYLYRYGVGTLSLFVGGGIGAGVKGAGLLGKGLNLAGKALTYKPVNVLQAGLQAARAGKNVKATMIGAKALNGAVDGLIAGAFADYNLYRPDENEGHLMDMFGDTDNKLVSFLQTKENDSEFAGRLKNVVDGVLISLPLGAAGELLLGNFFKGLHKASNAQTAKGATEGLAEAATAKISLDNVAKTEDLVATVKALKQEADETGEDLSQLIIDRLPTEKIEEAKEMGRLIEQGEDIFPHTDGSWSIKVTNWEDAYKVSPEEYKLQLSTQDPNGNYAIQQMDNAIKDTWQQRNLLDIDDGNLFNVNSRQAIINGNKNTENIVNYYKDKWGLDKAKIKVQFGKWKEVTEGNTSGTAKRILIQIDKDAPNPYATLRSELEHARDIIKGEVPAKANVEGSGEHFARYVGDNEAQIAPDFIHHKSQGKNKALQNQQTTENLMNNVAKYEAEGYKFEAVEPDGFGEARYNLKDVDGNNIGYIEYTVNDSTIQIDYVKNTSKGTDFEQSKVGEKLLDKILSEHPDKQILWDAISDEGIGFKKSYLAKHPELNEKVSGINDTTLAQQDELLYNESKGVTNEGSNRSNREELANRGQEDSSPNTGEISATSTTKPSNGIDGSLPSSNNAINARGENTFTDTAVEQLKNYHDNLTNEVETDFKLLRENLDKQYQEEMSKAKSTKKKNQIETAYKDRLNEIETAYTSALAKAENRAEKLKLEFNSAEEVATGVAKGEVKFETVEEVASAVEQVATKDPDVTGRKWIDVANDSDNYFAQYLEANPLEAAKLIANKDPQAVERIAREQISVAKLISVLRDKLDVAEPDAYFDILTSIKALEKYNKQVASSMGAGLGAQNINKAAMKSFGEERFSDLALENIKNIADILENIKSKYSLDFTRNLKTFKEGIYQGLREENTEFFDMLIQDKGMMKAFNKSIDEWYQQGKKGLPFDYRKAFQKNLMEDEAKVCGWYAKLSDRVDGCVNVIKHWGHNAPAYVINNILGFASAMKNITSGVIQTYRYPVTKILGGLLTGETTVTKEGINQIKNLQVNFGESLRLAKQAWDKGDGLLTNTKELVEGNIEGGFNPFTLNFSTIDDSKLSLQNLHSFFARLMMASDEFVSQLNYRSITRAKAIEQAEKGLAAQGIEITDDVLGAEVDRIFKGAFTEDGKPTDIKAFAEAKEMLFQTPLNRQMKDNVTGEMVDVGDKSLISKAGQALQSLTEQHHILKVFMPFIKTPANIADQTLKNNPLYMVLNKNTRDKFFSSDPVERAKAVGNFAVMTSLHFGAMIAAANGRITGSEPRDKETKIALYKTGWKPYSIRIGDKYIPYMGTIAPLDAVLAFSADCVAFKTATKQQEMNMGQMAGQVFGIVMNDYVDQTGFRTNVSKVLDLINPATEETTFEKAAISFLQGFLPASGTIRPIEQFGKHEKTRPETFYDNLVKNYLPAFDGQDYQRDVFGERVDQYGMIVANLSDNHFMQPEYTAMRELAEAGWTPSNMKSILEETRVNLKEFKDKNGRSAVDAMNEELTKVKIDGLTLRQAVAVLSQSQYYQSLPVGTNENGEDWNSTIYDTKIKLMSNLFHEYYDEAILNVTDKKDTFKTKDGMTMEQVRDKIHKEMEQKALGEQLSQLY